MSHEAKRWAINTLMVALIVAASILAFLVTGSSPQEVSGWNYQEAVVIILTALAALLAAMTIFLAVAAFVGYNAIREAAERAAVKRTDEMVARHLPTLMARYMPPREVADDVAFQDLVEALARENGS